MLPNCLDALCYTSDRKSRRGVCTMTICPIAIAVHCTGCPLVKFCPAKTILGDYKEENIDIDSNPQKTGKIDIQESREKPDDFTG